MILWLSSYWLYSCFWFFVFNVSLRFWPSSEPQYVFTQVLQSSAQYGLLNLNILQSVPCRWILTWFGCTAIPFDVSCFGDVPMSVATADFDYNSASVFQVQFFLLKLILLSCFHACSLTKVQMICCILIWAHPRPYKLLMRPPRYYVPLGDVV
jgi:hypothetical protein